MKRQKFVVCLNNDGYEASLEVGKIYQTIPDSKAESHGYLRVVDESGEDYAFDSSRFHPVRLPDVVKKSLLALAQT